MNSLSSDATSSAPEGCVDQSPESDNSFNDDFRLLQQLQDFDPSQGTILGTETSHNLHIAPSDTAQCEDANETHSDSPEHETSSTEDENSSDSEPELDAPSDSEPEQNASSDSESEPNADPMNTDFEPTEDAKEESPKLRNKPTRKRATNTGVAKTAQQKVRKNQRKLDEEFKIYIKNERKRKQGAGNGNVHIEPPKAKKMRTSSAKSDKKDQRSIEENFYDTGKATDRATANRPITQKERNEELKDRISHGTNNRRSGTQKRDLKEATSIFGYSKIVCFPNGEYYLKGMRETTKLREEQLPTVSWMVQREHGISPPFGGVLGDDVGLGKTMVSMACTVGNPASAEDLQTYFGATLIIVPSTDMAKQWRAEYLKHVEAIRDNEILIWSNAQWKESSVNFHNYKIVIATITEIRGNLTDEELKKIEAEHGMESDEYRAALVRFAGPVYGIKWYRIILDEGHAVKNMNTLSFKACYGLQRKSFWVLTATPLVDRETEIFPYLRLVGVEGINTYQDFKDRYLESYDCDTKMDALIHLATYRRTKKDKFLGRLITGDLPEFESKEVWVNLSRHERMIYDLITEHYDALEKREGLSRINCHRMMISHAWNIEGVFRDDLNPAFLTNLRDGLKELAADSSTIPQTRRILHAAPPNDQDSELFVTQEPTVGNSSSKSQDAKTKRKKKKSKKTEEKKSTKSKEDRIFHIDSTDKTLGMENLLKYTINEQMVDEGCTKCKKTSIDKPWIISQPYDRKTDARLVENLSTKETEYAEVDRVRALKEAISAPPTATPTKRTPKKSKRQKQLSAREEKKIVADFTKKKYGGDYRGVFLDLKGKDNAFINIGVHETDGMIPLSSKTACTMDYVLQFQSEAPEDKIIVFHEFLKTAKILGIALRQYDIPFYYFNGEMSAKSREDAITSFKNDPSIKVLLASKVGKEGLNLTCANRIINIDNWWNKAAQQQIFGRIDRTGQTKKMYAVVIRAADTIDEHIDDLQETKAEKVAHRMQDDRHETKLMSYWEVMMHTAPMAYQAKCAQLIKEIEEEEASEDNEEDAAEAAPGARLWVKV
ncbi:putative ATP-dependent helicase [Colletotrichum fructicola]|nr:putative ATP-dependent helicase [Colletotrichum fructicola]